MEIHSVEVIGLGPMGAGIAEVFARAGFAVTAEVDPTAPLLVDNVRVGLPVQGVAPRPLRTVLG